MASVTPDKPIKDNVNRNFREAFLCAIPVDVVVEDEETIACTTSVDDDSGSFASSMILGWSFGSMGAATGASDSKCCGV